MAAGRLTPALGRDLPRYPRIQLSPVGHSGELPTCLPLFLFVPWYHRLVMIVGIIDQTD